MTTNSEISWAAGFFEGEGSVQCWLCNKTSIREPERKYAYLQAEAHQVERECLDRLQSILGGKVYGPYSNNKGSSYYKWFANGKTAETAMNLIEDQLSSRRKNQLFSARQKVQEIMNRPKLKMGP